MHRHDPQLALAVLKAGYQIFARAAQAAILSNVQVLRSPNAIFSQMTSGHGKPYHELVVGNETFHVTRQSLQQSLWAIWLATEHWDFGRCPQVLPLHTVLSYGNKPFFLDDMDAHSYFLAITRDYMNEDLADVLSQGKLSAER